MRLLVTSDLHYDPRGQLTDRQTIRALVENMARERADAVVLAGDIAHGLDAFRTCVSQFSDLSCPVYVLAGNHDVWKDKQRGISSEELWTKELPSATAEAGGIWLEATTARIGDVGLAGSLAWYDYSGLDHDAGVAVDKVGALKKHLNNDAHWIDWAREDVSFARALADGLVQRVAHLAKDPGVEKIAVVTHVPVFEEQMHRKPGDRSWGVGNAYFGHLTLGDRLNGEPKLRAVISGHTHWGVETTRDRGALPAIDVRVVGSDYKIPNFTRVDL